jgi:Domain of unknown function (DUF4124)
MDKRPIFLLIGLLAGTAALADEAYRWVDDDGIVHYSDRPQPGAELVILPKSSAPTRPVARAAAPTRGTAKQPDKEKPFKYESLQVASPGPEETLWNIESVLNVSLAVKPAIQPGHQVRVYFDGNAELMPGTSFQIEEVYRGVHTIQAEIIDATGKLMIRSRSNRFYVQQNTVNF